VGAENRTTASRMHHGDQAPPGTPGTGDNSYRERGGEGSLHGKRCESCGGTGTVIEGVGSA
jgi:hypothetical protein